MSSSELEHLFLASQGERNLLENRVSEERFDFMENPSFERERISTSASHEVPRAGRETHRGLEYLAMQNIGGVLCAQQPHIRNVLRERRHG